MLSPIQTLALSKCITAKAVAEARSLVIPGTYEGAVDVSVDYAMTVNASVDAAQSVKWKQLALDLASNVNAATLARVARDYLAGDTPAVSGRVTAWAESIREGAGRSRRAGSVRVEADVSPLASARFGGGAA